MQLKIMSKMSCRVMIWESCCLLEVFLKELSLVAYVFIV